MSCQVVMFLGMLFTLLFTLTMFTLDEPTYKDVIRESFKKVKDTEKQYDE